MNADEWSRLFMVMDDKLASLTKEYARFIGSHEDMEETYVCLDGNFAPNELRQIADLLEHLRMRKGEA